MEDIHTFSGGMHENFDFQNQPKNTYRDAWNWIRLEDGSLTNEDGTVNIPSFPFQNTVLGSIVIGEEIVFFSYHFDAELIFESSEIGVLDVDNVYTTILNDPALGFTLDHQIKGVGKIDYRGHRLVYFIDVNGGIPFRYLDLDAPAPVDVDDDTKGFLESSIPVVTVDSVTEDGNLPTGIYQFSVRLLTASTNATTTSLLTNIVPIVDEALTGGVTNYDGALPQTESFKSINLVVSNIDQSFEYVQLIATTYDGLTNTIKSNVISTRAIVGTTMNFKYSSLEQNGEELTTDELTIEPIEYSNPKAIEQKDGRLLLANLGVRNHSPNFQQVANAIGVRYKIKDFDYNESINISFTGTTGSTTGVDNGAAGTQFNNYKDELNTTNFKGYQRDEVYSFGIVPIFKNLNFGYAYHIPALGLSYDADTGTKELGVYTNINELYPPDMGFGALEGTFVRYHHMPTMAQENIFTVGSNKIRVLGVEFYNIDLSVLPEDELANIIGYVIVRELRTEQNKSILAQGIINSFTGSVSTAGVRVVSPWSGKDQWDYNDAIVPVEPAELVHSAFYSPETTILKNSMLSADKIKAVANMSGSSYIVADDRTGGANEEYAHFFLNYGAISTIDGGEVDINKGATQYIPAESGVIPLDGTPAINVGTYDSNGFLYLNTTTDVPIYENPFTRDRINDGLDDLAEITYDLSGGTSDIRLAQGGFLSISSVATTGDTRRRLFNLIATKDNQYGGVMDKEYILINYRLLDGTVADETLECYSGDTFINKTSIVSTTSMSGNEDLGLKFRTVSYFWCESSVNTAYRHYTTSGSVFTSVPYYPKYKKFWNPEGDGLLQFLPSFGHANGYNRQYSFDNVIKRFFSKPLIDIEEVSSFTNRVIYSEQSIEGEQFDSYRLFLHNNYHDIPKNKGEITNMFVLKNDLYIHTEQSLWKSSFNENVTQVSSAGEVVLGNGGLFPRPSLEIFPVTGGYAGSIDPLVTCNTPYGVYFLDRLQKKVFYLGSSFEEIDAGMRLTIQSYLEDPTLFRPKSTYDYKHDRWLFSANLFCLSYSPKLKSWTSNHDYNPIHMVSVNTKVIMSDDHTIDILNEGPKGIYFVDPLVESSLVVISNDNALTSKTFDNAIINSNKAFTDLECLDESNKNATKTLVEDDSWEFEPSPTEQRITKANSEYRLALPLDEFDRRFKGKWCSLEFAYNNLDDERFIVKYINIKYRVNAR